DRRVNGKVLEFAVSGLAYNANSLIYDVHRETAGGKQTIGGESLFLPMLVRGVSGTSAGKSLSPVSVSLTTWSDWSAIHPQTSVLDRNLSMAKRYDDAKPTSYFNDPKPLRPVKPAPPDANNEGGIPYKTPVVIVSLGEMRRVFPIPAIDRNAD